MMPTPTTSPAFALWFRRSPRESWRVVAIAETSIEANDKMHGLLDDGHPSGDWYTAEGGMDPNRPTAKRATA